MFIISKIKDTISVQPSNLSLEPSEAISDGINTKYSNKILQDVGLCICLYDLLDCSEGFVQHSNGSVYYKVVFRLVIFRPFVGEILFGKVKTCNPDGISITLGFFDDIWVPANLLPEITTYDMAEATHFWLASWDGQSDPFTSSPDERAYIDIGEDVRVRVEAEHFEDIYPTPKKNQDEGEDSRPPSYRLTCSMDGQGLGVLSWWGEATIEDENVEMAEE